MTEIAPIESFLSSNIRRSFYLISSFGDLSYENDGNFKIYGPCHIKKEDNFYLYLEVIFPGTEKLVKDTNWYENSIVKIAPLFKDIKYFHFETGLKCQYCLQLKWTSYEEQLKSVKIYLEDFENSGQIYLALLTTVALVERILGDVFLIRGKTLPFLLCDLLNAQELISVLGDPLTDFLKVLFGSVHGLNLRNLAWHGFLSAKEVRREHTIILLYALHLCGIHLSKANLQITSRAWLSMNEVHISSQNCMRNCILDVEAQQIISSSPLVFPMMKPYWEKAFTLWQNGKKEAVVLLLPILENALRILYAKVNQCPSRMLTATNVMYYTTLDEMLSFHISKKTSETSATDSKSCDYNFVPQVLGKQLAEALYDIFSHSQGPRLRDRLSHCEILAKNVPYEIISHLFGICMLVLALDKWRFLSRFDEACSIKCRCEHLVKAPLFCHNHYPCNTRSHLAEFFPKEKSIDIDKKSLINNLATDLLTYKSAYHPLSILKQNLIETCEKANEWKLWDKPQDYYFGTDYTNININLNPVLGFQSSHKSLEDLPQFINLSSTIVLFSPKSELQVCNILQRIITAIDKCIANIEISSRLKYHLHKIKEMRSRQRLSYWKQLDALPSIMNHVIISLNVVALFYVNINFVAFYSQLQYSELIKFLRNVLKVFENICSFTECSTNKYQETLTLLEANTRNIHVYFENAHK